MDKKETVTICDINFEGCKDKSYFPNCGDCVYLSTKQKMDKTFEKIWNAVTSNGCREMDEIRFEQAAKEVWNEAIEAAAKNATLYSLGLKKKVTKKLK
jgi:hypothetical protein